MADGNRPAAGRRPALLRRQSELVRTRRSGGWPDRGAASAADAGSSPAADARRRLCRAARSLAAACRPARVLLGRRQAARRIFPGLHPIARHGRAAACRRSRSTPRRCWNGMARSRSSRPSTPDRPCAAVRVRGAMRTRCGRCCRYRSGTVAELAIRGRVELACIAQCTAEGRGRRPLSIRRASSGRSAPR